MKKFAALRGIAIATCLVGLILALAPTRASAGPFWRRTVVVTTPAPYPVYVTPAPTVYTPTVYTAPVSSVVTPTVSTVAPTQAVFSTPAVVANPVVQTTYVAPATTVIRPNGRVRVYYPRAYYPNTYVVLP